MIETSQYSDTFIEDLEAALKEAEVVQEAIRLNTTELYYNLMINDIRDVARELLIDSQLIEAYGNKTITSYKELITEIQKIPLDKCYGDIIEFVAAAYGCTYNQATTKIAVAYNINLPGDTWFKRQMNILADNSAKLDNADTVSKFAQFKAYKNSPRRYYTALLDLFQCTLEAKGIFYDGGDMPLVASISDRYMMKITRTKCKETVRNNMANIASYNMTHKLTDEQVKDIDNDLYIRVKKLCVAGQVITTYQLVDWTDDLLDEANNIIKADKTSGKTNKGVNATTLHVLGHDGIIYKGVSVNLSEEDKANVDKLYKWAYKKCYEKGRAGFFTLDEYKEQFGSNKVNVGKNKMNQYRIILCAMLNLDCARATKVIMNAVGTKKALKLIGSNKTVFVPHNTINKGEIINESRKKL
jgi:hypothetical protein